MAQTYTAYQSAPVTQQAVVTVNAGFDRLFCNFRKAQDLTKANSSYRSTDDHCYSIQQRELVFRLKPKFERLINRPSTGNGVNDMTLKVFSSVNMFPEHTRLRNVVNKLVPTAVSAAAILRDAITFVGVAATPVDYLNQNQKDNLAVQVAGSCTIWNTGTKVIRPGQKIVWELPNVTAMVGSKRKNIQGEPLDKFLLATMPLESVYADGKQAYDFVDGLMQMHPHGTHAVGTSEEAKLLDSLMGAHDDYLRAVISMYEEVRTRVIGVALSGASPGESFDIMLCSFH